MEPDPRGFWLSDRAISYPWTYVKNKNYNLTYQYHISSFVDIVARGGIFLISLTPKGDGSIPDEEKFIMGKIGDWLEVNGEGIYGTRPWKTVGEGTPVSQIRKMTPHPKGAKASWDYKLLEGSGRDVRFTKKGNSLYAFVIGMPEGGRITVESLAKGNVEKNGGGIKNVTMLGSAAKIKWSQNAKGLTLNFPGKLPCEVAYGFKIEVDGILDDAPKETFKDGIERVGVFPIYNTPR
jgi:alpha-L-fucosidase